MGLTTHQKIGAGMLLAIFISGLISILTGAPRLDPDITVLARVVMTTLQLITIVVCVFYTWLSMRQLLPTEDYVRPQKLSVWQVASLLIPTTFAGGGIMIVWNHIGQGGFSNSGDAELKIIQLWLVVIGMTIIATIATTALLIWHKWHTVEVTLDKTTADMLAAAFPNATSATLEDVLEGKLRSDIREVIAGFEYNNFASEVIVFTNVFDMRLSRLTVAFKRCLDQLGHVVKNNRLDAERNAGFRENQTPAYIFTTQAPVGHDYVRHLVCLDRRTGVAIIISEPLDAHVVV